MRNNDQFDVVILGGGSGGLAAAFRAAAYGASVALLEPLALGGTCVNVGCVPKKAMWLAAELAEKLPLAATMGFDLPSSIRINWPTLLTRRQQYIANIHSSYRQRLDENGICHIPQRGQLIDQQQVCCADGRVIRARHIVIATGSQPFKPSDIEGAELGGVSDDFFAWSQCPERVAIMGGGYIAVELANVLQALGSQVHLLVRGPRLLRGFDAEMAEQLAANLIQQGVKLHLNCAVRALHSQQAVIQIHTHSPSSQESLDLSVDKVLFATGRIPNTRGLGLETIGITRGKQGEISVDEFQTTSIPNIFAVGDVTGKAMLTPVAIAAARRLMDRLYGNQPEARLDYKTIPSVIFSHPPFASVGLSEEAARAQFTTITVYYSRFRPMIQALGNGQQRSVFKMICAGDEEKVVGIHLLGEAADEILQGFAVALKLGATRQQFLDTVAIHPTSAEEVVLMR